MSQENLKNKAQKRMEVFLKVKSGTLRAKDAGNQLGVSREIYNRLMNRGNEALLQAMTDKPAGRPKIRNLEMENSQTKISALTQEVEALKRKLHLMQTLTVKNGGDFSDEKKR